MFTQFLPFRHIIVLLVGVALLQPLRGVAEDAQAKITGKQAVYLHARAKVVRRSLDKLKKKLSKWERRYGPETMIGPWGEMEAEATLGGEIQKAIQITNSTYYKFTAISASEQQTQAAKDFFGDILSRYARLMERARVAPSCHPECYPQVRDEAIQALELNALAYKTVADTASETFDLGVESTPPGAMILYKRDADGYRKHPDQTNTTIATSYTLSGLSAFTRTGSKIKEKNTILLLKKLH